VGLIIYFNFTYSYILYYFFIAGTRYWKWCAISAWNTRIKWWNQNTL